VRLGLHLYFAGGQRYIRGESPPVCSALGDLLLVVFFESTLVRFATVETE
jgi:hypothetical protein